MTLENLLSTIDAEIARLQQARAVLSGSGGNTAPKNGRRKRSMSAEGRKRIAEAQRKRWAAQKKAMAKTV